MIILPSLEIVPAKYNGSTLLSQIPIDGTGDFAVTRATSPTTNRSTRVNALGLIETVADNVPRLDYPIGGGCPALLVEPSAQNQCQRSEEFNNAFHFPNNLNAFGSGSVANTTATRDPYGTNLADYIQEDSAASAQHSIIDIFAGNVSGTTYTWSVFAKAAERTIIQLANNAGGGGVANFNLTTGVATLTNGVSCSMQNYGNGWWRCILTYTSATVTPSHNVQIRLCDASGNPSYNGTGNQGAYIFGAQLEVSQIATSYIPTVASGITRAADVIKDTTASGVIGQVEGTVYWEGAINRLDRIFFTLASGSSTTDLVRLQTTGAGLIQGVVVLTGTLQCAVSSLGAITLGQFNKVAFAYKQDDFVLYLNGVRQNADVSGSLPTNLNAVYFLSSNGTEITDQQCRAAALYPTRLTDTQLALLTSPYTSYSSMASALSYTLG